MFRVVTAVAALLATAGVARAQYGCYGGYGGPPVKYGFVVLKDGRVQTRQYVLQYRAETATAKKLITENGVPKEVQYQYTVIKPVPLAVMSVLDLGKLRATDAAGIRIGAEALAERLKTETLVLLVFDGQELDARYRRILKKGTLVLNVPRSTPLAPMPAENVPGKSAPTAKDTEEVRGPGATGQPPPAPESGKEANGPRGPQPSLAGASVDGKGVLYVRESSGRTDTQTAYREVDSGGIMRKVPVRVRDVVVTTRMRTLDLAGAAAYRADGTPVAPAALRQLLAKEVPALVSLDGKRVDPFYLQIIRGDTLILVLPVPGYGQSMPPPEVVPPAPAPAPESVPPPPRKKLPPPI